MTNYIDLLLEQQLERQEEDRGTWRTGAVRVPRPGREEETPASESAGRSDQSDQVSRPVWAVPAGGKQAAEPPVRSGEEMEQGLIVRLTDGTDGSVRPQIWDGEETGNGLRHDGEPWSARRWVAGEGTVNQAGVRMAEVRQTAGTAERADRLPDPPRAGRAMEHRAEQSGNPSGGGIGAEAWRQAVYIPAEERLPAGLARVARGGLDGAPVETASAGAEWLDRAVRVSLGGLPASDRQSQVVTLEPAEWDTGAKSLELRQLDRLVRRDARRFDGGFQLL